MSSIQGGAGHPVRVVVRPEKSGPVVSIFALASPSEHTQGPSGLVLGSGNGQEIARSMYLEKEGLVVDFNWWGAKGKDRDGCAGDGRAAVAGETTLGRNRVI